MLVVYDQIFLEALGITPWAFDWRLEQVWNGSRQERELSQGTKIKTELPVLHHKLTHVDIETNCHEDNCRGEQSPVRMSK